MANDIKFGPARIVQASIMHTMNNGVRFESYGTLQALRNSQNKTLQDAMSPKGAKALGNFSIVKGSGGVDDLIPRVVLNYRGTYSTGTHRTTRETKDLTGSLPNSNELNIDYTLRHEYDVPVRVGDLATIEAATDAYYKQIRGSQVSTKDVDFSGLDRIGFEVMLSMGADLLSPTNNSALTALIAGVGTYKDTNASTAPNLYLYDAEGKVRKDVWAFFNNLARVHGIIGKPVVLGGKLLASFMDEAKIASPADIGVDFAKMFQSTAVEWYYDPAVDTLLGADKILILDPNAACVQAIMEHIEILKDKKVANTTFGTGSINIAQNDAPNFVWDFDIRVQENDRGKYPGWLVTVSDMFGVFTRPAGYFSALNNWAGVTGIWQAKLVKTEPVV